MFELSLLVASRACSLQPSKYMIGGREVLDGIKGVRKGNRVQEKNGRTCGFSLSPLATNMVKLM